MRASLLCAVCALLLALQTSAAATTITVTPSARQVSPGTQASVTISIDGLGAGTAPSLGTYDVNLGFDPLLLSFVSATFGNQLDIFGFGDIQTVTPSTDSVNVFELSLDSATDLNNLQLSAFALATLTFDTTAMGTSPLTISLNALGDADGNALEADIQNSSIAIQDGTPTSPAPEPSSAALVGLIVVALATASWQSGRQPGAYLIHTVQTWPKVRWAVPSEVTRSRLR